MLKSSVFSQVYQAMCSYSQDNALFVDETFYTYGELKSYVGAVRHLLQSNGVKKGDIVGLLAGHDVQTYASLLAILSIGAAYLPLNKKNPYTRMVTVLEDAQANVVLTSLQMPALDEVSKSHADRINIVDTSAITPVSDSWEPCPTEEDTLLYLIYTSGSTGKPKGVPISNAHLNAFLEHFDTSSDYDFSGDDRFLQMIELTFDPSVMSLFLPLRIGACVYVVPAKGITYINVAKMLASQNITVAVMVPSVINYLERFFQELNFEKLKFSFFCGEPLLDAVVKKWSGCMPNGRIVNIYGPTEATIVCTEYFWDPEKSESVAVNGVVPIGKPLKRSELHVLDKNGNVASDGEKGELCISGDQIAGKYWENPDKTAEAFQVVQINGEPCRIYRTGDISFWNNQGDLVFCGRMDSQVKIDGYRIELGEIESFARDCVESPNVAVLALKNEQSDNELHLFLEKNVKSKEDVKQYLKDNLPSYMTPKHIHFIDEMPLNESGKIARKVLASMV